MSFIRFFFSSHITKPASTSKSLFQFGLWKSYLAESNNFLLARLPIILLKLLREWDLKDKIINQIYQIFFFKNFRRNAIAADIGLLQFMRDIKEFSENVYLDRLHKNKILYGLLNSPIYYLFLSQGLQRR